MMIILTIFLFTSEHAEQVQAVVGNIAELPCDLTVNPGDRIRLILWSMNSTVIYR